ncbi:MAG: replication-associated recombination protein A [candidate division KSB1 bacterium]|nr:replication-associated recombination protein A [candidate division KSB1 bacterium]
MDLFDHVAEESRFRDSPLANLLRPKTLDEFIGQSHLVGEGRPLRLLMQNQRPISMILWGPPGVGKTTLARLFAQACDADFLEMSAVASGVADVKKVIEKATKNRQVGRRTILFIDEIHRFNKAQQDALLHAVEDGTLFLIGATTENPSFEVIRPLLSRCRVYILNPLSKDELAQLFDRALPMLERKIEGTIRIDQEARDLLLELAAGDARELLNGLELAVLLVQPDDQQERHITAETVTLASQRKTPHYDRAGEMHYDTISAFIKSLRGSDPDAAMHYLARMLDAGEEPRFIARRLLIFASEDVGNAEPMALVLANAAFQAAHVIGMPEAQIILAQATTYLASAPKSNASYVAIKQAMNDVRNRPLEAIPLHLRNAATGLLKDLEYGKDYQYPHDFPGGFVRENYFPEGWQDRVYYRPKAAGAEEAIRKRLKTWWPDRYEEKKE